MFSNHFKFLAYLIAVIGFGTAAAGSYEDFFIAITRDKSAQVQELLKRGFDPNSRDPKGQTGLYLALRGESYQAAAVLVEAPGLDVNALSSAGESPLMMAALRGQIEMCRQLLQRGAAVNQPGWTPLHYAATGPNADVTKLLLERGAALEAESPNGTTPLMMAARYGPEASVDLLLARGADLKRRNQLGLSAVDFARQGGREALTRRLLEAAK